MSKELDFGNNIEYPNSKVNIFLLNPPQEILEREKRINPFDHEYHTLLRHILKNGVSKGDRTGTGTRSIFGYQMRFNLSEGFPLLTTKKLHTKSIVYELLWFLKGETNIDYLNKHGVHIWDEWADEKGELGPVYGSQWRFWKDSDGKTIDQISQLVEAIKKNPNSRRHIVTAWNPAEVDQMALPPCHTIFQLYVTEGRLSCQMYQRSADTFLGVPFNIASYALLTSMLAQSTGHQPGEFIHTIGDVHLYNNHIDQAHDQLRRIPYHPPTLELNPQVNDIFEFEYDDIKVVDYHAHPNIKASISV